MKFNTILLAHGVCKIIYHAGTTGSINNDSASGIFFEWAGAPRKMAAAQAAMANLLTPPIKPVELPKRPANVLAYGFETDGRVVIVAWAEEGKPAVAASADKGGWRTFDIQGNEIDAGAVLLTGRPVYFVRQGTGAEGLPWAE